MTDVASRWRWFRRAGVRRAVFAVLAVAFGLLALFPRHYTADVQLAPQDTNTAGLNSILSQLGGNYAALLGNHQPVEIDLAIARSYAVQTDVVRRLGVPNDPVRLRDAVRQLERHTGVHAVRGNIIEVEIEGRDPDYVLRAAGAYSDVMQGRLGQLSREQTAFKRQVLEDRMREATDRLTRAENAITAFRQQNRLVEPQEQLSAGLSQLTQLQGELQGKQVELATALRFNAPDSFPVQALQTQLAALRAQVARAQAGATLSGGSAATIAPKSLEYQRLDRELRFSQALFEAYTRYLEGASIENLTAEFNMQVLQPPYLETSFQFNIIPLVLLVLTLLVAVGAELYFFRPPVGITRGTD